MTMKNARGQTDSADIGSISSSSRAGAAAQQPTGAHYERDATGADAPPRHRHSKSDIAAAVRGVTRRNSTVVSIPPLGKVTLPPRDELAFLAGTALLAVVGVIEWPVALLMGAGFTLKHHRHNRVLQEFGEALEGA